MKFVTFIFPIYNQEHVLMDGLTRLYGYLTEKNIDFEVLICNDGSTDDSKAIADQLAKLYEKVFSIGYKTNRGKGYALKYAGFHAKGNHIIYMDCDLLTMDNLHYIDQVIERLDSSEVVIASRFHREADTKRKLVRNIVGIIFRTLVRVYFRKLSISDPDVGFKGFHADVFRTVNMVTNLNGPSWDLQFLVNASSEGYKISEVPFSYVESYSRTTVNVFKCSIVEFIGLNYIWVTLAISRRVIF